MGTTNSVAMKKINLKDYPEMRKLWWVALIVQVAWGFTEGIYMYIWGPYFYEKFGSPISPAHAMFLTTILLGLRQGLVALLEIPTGALADAIGRVHAVILSWVARVVFFVCLAAIWLCHTVSFAFTFGMLASVAFALSYTLFNGAFSAWCMDKLKEINAPVNYTWLAARFMSYRSFSTIFGTLLGVGCYIVGLPFFGFCIAAIVSFAGMGFCMSQVEETRNIEFVRWKKGQLSKVTRRIGEIIGKGFDVSLKTPVLFWIILTYGAFMFLVNIVCYLWPVYLHSRGGVQNFSSTWLVVASLAPILMFVGSRALAWLNDRWSHSGGTSAHIIAIRRIFVGFALFSALFVLGLSWETLYQPIGVFFFPGAVLFVLLSFGVISPCFETLVNHYIPPEDAPERATILSAGSMLRSFLILVLAVPSGGGSGEKSPIGWALPAVLLLFSVLVANFFMRKVQKEKGLIQIEGGSL